MDSGTAPRHRRLPGSRRTRELSCRIVNDRRAPPNRFDREPVLIHGMEGAGRQWAKPLRVVAGNLHPRRAPSTQATGGSSMKTLSVVIPVYNERRTIADALDRVRMAPTLGLQKDLVVVDDFSTDGTAEYLRGLSSDRLICLFHDRNRGKGAALRTGFARATGD